MKNLVQGRLKYIIGMLAALVVSVATAPALLAQASVPPGTWGPDGVVVELNVMVPMRDGVRLATDVYLPAKDGQVLPGKFPTLLSRTPYNKSEQPITPGLMSVERVRSSHMAYYMASHGYAVVLQDVRGLFNSEGEFHMHPEEGQDGYDALEWAAAQPWSNGKVGTYGGSYLATTQDSLAALNPPHLAAMFVTLSDSNYYFGSGYHGGEYFLLHNLFYPLSFARIDHVGETNPGHNEEAASVTDSKNLDAWLKAYPYGPNASPLRFTPHLQEWFQNSIDHYTFDSYWKQNGFDYENRYKDYPDIPIYYTSGWYDLYERGTLHNYMGMAALHKSPTKLMMGPWKHTGVGNSWTGEVDFGPSAAFGMAEQQLRFFDSTMKGEKNGVLAGPPVRIFVMGGGSGRRNTAGRMEDGGQWYDTTAWPPPEAKSTSFYLHKDGTLSETAPGADEGSTTFTYDPNHPVPMIGGQNDFGSEQYEEAGPVNQVCKLTIPFCEYNQPLSSRHDVVVYETPALTSDTVIAGHVTVDLWISSSAKDTDFTAKLIDQGPQTPDYPEGFAMNLEDWIIKVSLYPDFQKMNLLEPGEIREVQIDLQGIANRFVKGHRIRLDISSSNFPFYAANPNTGERPGYETHKVIAQNTIYQDAAHPSHVNLPLLPVSALAVQQQH